MDFSSANVPISRDTWAPRSPPPRAAPAPSASGGGDARPPSGGYDDRAPPPPRDYNSNGSGDRGAPPPPRDRESGGDYGGGSRYSRDNKYDDRRDAPYAPPPRSGPAPKVDPNPVLGVFGISMRTMERDLDDEFSRYGDVEKVVIVYDQTTGRSRGFGFVTMRNTEDAARCVEKLNGLDLHGRQIRVDFSATTKPHAPTPGEYKGAKRFDRDRYGGGGRYEPYPDRRGDRYDDRRRYDDRDRRDRDYRRDDDPYGGRSRRDDDRERRRSPSPRRARYDSPERRAPPRDYDRPAPAAETSRY